MKGSEMLQIAWKYMEMRSETNTSINTWPSTRSTNVAHSMHMRDERLRNVASSMEIYGNEFRNQHVSWTSTAIQITAGTAGP